MDYGQAHNEVSRSVILVVFLKIIDMTESKWVMSVTWGGGWKLVKQLAAIKYHETQTHHNIQLQ